MRRKDFLITLLLISIFLVIMSFRAYSVCVPSSILCNSTNNDTEPCLSANETFNYTYYFVNCSESVGVSFMGSQPPLSSQYAPGKNYTFNVTVNSLENLENVFFESNYTTNASQSGNLYNYSYPNVTNASDVFTINLTDLPVQKFVYRWIGINGTHYASTGIQEFSIIKGTLNISINITPDYTVVYPVETTATGIENNEGDGDVNYTLWRGNELLGNPETTTLDPGTYNYVFNSSGGENWTVNSTGVSAVLTVQADNDAPFVPSGGSGEMPVVTTVTRAEGKANVTIKSLASGKTINVTILKTENLAIRKLSVTVNNVVNNVMITIKKLQATPSTVSYDLAKVYNYISIDKQNITDSDISEAIIRFAVTKQWLEDNDLDYQNISLYRWETNTWNELPTNYLSNDSIEYFYEAVSPGFSTFVIGASGSETVLIESSCTELWSCSGWTECSDGLQTRICTDEADCGTTATKPAESQECGTTAETEPEPFPIFEVSIVIIVAIIAIVIVVLVLTGKIHLPSIRKGSQTEETKTEYVYTAPEKGADDKSYRKKDSDDEKGLQ